MTLGPRPWQADTRAYTGFAGLNPPAVHSSFGTLSGPLVAVKHPHEAHHDVKRNWFRSLAFSPTAAGHLRRSSHRSSSSRTSSDMEVPSSAVAALTLAISSGGMRT